MAGMNISEVSLVSPLNNDKSNIPVGRSGHRIVVTAEALYSIGGFNPEYWNVPNKDGTIYPLFNELWKFNFSTKTWQLLSTDGFTPSEMASHTALLIGDKLFVHGGTGTPFGHASSNQLNVCDLKSLTWKHIETFGELPEELYGHTLTLVNSSQLYMFGGTTGFEYRNSLHKLTLGTKEWTELVFDKSLCIPEGRYRHETVCDNKYLYVLGGGCGLRDFGFGVIDAFDIDKGRWEKLACHGQVLPAPRRCHAALKYKQFAVILGGYDRECVFSDVWRLDLKSLEWSKVCDLAEPVYFHSADVTEYGTVYVYGGVNEIDGKRNSNIYRFCLDPPPLREQCWDVLSRHINNNMSATDLSELTQMGVPESFVSRLR